MPTVTTPTRVTRPTLSKPAPVFDDESVADEVVETTPVKGKLSGTTRQAVGRLNAVGKAVNESLIGRADAVNAVVLALASGTNALLLGVPGTAKTDLVRKLARGLGDDPVFDILMTKFTKPFEVFGPTDPAGMMKGEVHVNTAGYLPEATVGVLDEIFKASSPVLNALLTLANERKFKNGSAWMDCPTRMLVGMSNEYPEDPALLAAFYDRFPLKVEVGYLEDGQFRDMLTHVVCGHTVADVPALEPGDLDTIDNAVSECVVPGDLLNAIRDVRASLRQRGIVVSDRRWVQAVKIVKAHAVLAGRSTASRADLSVLGMVVWNEPKDRPIVTTVLQEFSNPIEREIKQVLDLVYAQRDAVIGSLNVAWAGKQPDSNRPSPDITSGTRAAANALNKIRTAESQLDIIDDPEQLDEASKPLMDEARMVCKNTIGVVIALARGKDVTAELLKMAT